MDFREFNFLGSWVHRASRATTVLIGGYVITFEGTVEYTHGVSSWPTAACFVCLRR
jgi:hypothetical protein